VVVEAAAAFLGGFPEVQGDGDQVGLAVEDGLLEGLLQVVSRAGAPGDGALAVAHEHGKFPPELARQRGDLRVLGRVLGQNVERVVVVKPGGLLVNLVGFVDLLALLLLLQQLRLQLLELHVRLERVVDGHVDLTGDRRLPAQLAFVQFGFVSEFLFVVQILVGVLVGQLEHGPLVFGRVVQLVTLLLQVIVEFGERRILGSYAFEVVQRLAFVGVGHYPRKLPNFGHAGT